MCSCMFDELYAVGKTKSPSQEDLLRHAILQDLPVCPLSSSCCVILSNLASVIGNTGRAGKRGERRQENWETGIPPVALQIIEDTEYNPFPF